jgi:hypothetical protein
MTADTHSFAISPRLFARVLSSTSRPRSEGAGNAGRSMRPQPRVRDKKAHEQVTTVTPETPGIPRAMVLRLISCSPATGLVCHRRPRCCHRELDASVGASGPHDFAVRLTRHSSKAPSASTASRPASVTIASAPLGDGTAGNIAVICVFGKSEYCCKQGWTGKIIAESLICPSGKSDHGLRADTDHVDPVGASANRQASEIANRERRH